MANAAYETFRKCSADLIKTIQDHDLPILTWELYSAGVLSISIVEEVGMGMMGLEEKKTKLLSAVGNQISVDPAMFQDFLRALGKLPLLNKVVDKLETTYRNFGM